MPAAPIRLSDLEDAMLFANGGVAVYLDTVTGQFHHDLPDMDEELPDDVLENERYVAIPCKRDLGLGKPAALDFAVFHMPDALDTVYEIFSRRGAFARFRNFLDRRGMLEQWHAYENAAEARQLREWCEAQGIPLID